MAAVPPPFNELVILHHYLILILSSMFKLPVWLAATARFLNW